MPIRRKSNNELNRNRINHIENLESKLMMTADVCFTPMVEPDVELVTEVSEISLEGTSDISLDDGSISHALESMRDLLFGDIGGLPDEDLSGLSDFRRNSESFLGQLGSGMEEFLVDDSSVSDALTDPFSTERKATPFGVSTDGIGSDVANNGGSEHESTLDSGARGYVIIDTQTTDDGSVIVTRHYYDSSAQLLSSWTKAILSDGSAYESVHDHETGEFEYVFYDDTGEEIVDDTSVDELQDPDSGNGTGWTPPWQDPPDYTLDLNGGIVLVFPNLEQPDLGSNTDGQFEVNPMVTIINPDPESGYSTKLNSEETTLLTDSDNQVLPPGPGQF